jgi:CheY-like chemotaxis protein
LALNKINSSDTLHSDLNEIYKAAKRSIEITRQLLTFARKQTISPEVLDVNSIIEGMLKMLRHLIGEDINLVWVPEYDLWPVKIDPTQIDQILTNLCINARDAIGGVGKIIIETHNVTYDKAFCDANENFIPGDYVLLTVSDDGSGIEKETLDSIFEPFFTTKTESHGTGLGLSMIFGIVKQNKGFINLYSEPEKGTTFRIYLPRYMGKTEKIKIQTPEELTLGHGETVLLVEDEPAILMMSQTMLELLGYEVLAIGTPNKALHMAGERTGEIHLLITDVVMPEMNGHVLANQLHELYPDIKTLFMSGYTADVIAHRGVLEEGVNFIQKPFSIKNLGIKVRTILDQKKPD